MTFQSIPSPSQPRVQFNITARKDHADYPVMLKAKELFDKLALDNNISKPALLLKLIDSFALLGNFTDDEKQLISAASKHEGVSIEEFSRRSTLLYANKIITKPTTVTYKQEAEAIAAGSELSFVAKPANKADLKISRIVNKIMQSNDQATCWQDKRELTIRSVTEWLKHADTFPDYKSISYPVLTRYFMLHRDEIKQHHALHNIKPGHNRLAVGAKLQAIKREQSQAKSKQSDNQ